MTFDAARFTDAELERLIGYLKRNGLAGDPRYAAAVAESEARHGRGLTLDSTLAMIRAAVREDRFLTYKELSDGSGRRWGQGAMAEVNAHLGRLCDWARARGLPMFSAWVVRKDSLPRGRLSGSALKGFLDYARSLGHDPGATEAEQAGFVEAQRAAIRAWASGPA